MKKREGKMAGPCFSRLEAFFEDYFHLKKKVSELTKGEHDYEELGNG